MGSQINQSVEQLANPSNIISTYNDLLERKSSDVSWITDGWRAQNVQPEKLSTKNTEHDVQSNEPKDVSSEDSEKRPIMSRSDNDNTGINPKHLSCQTVRFSQMTKLYRPLTLAT